MLCASHRNTQGDREKNFCSVTRQKRSGNYISLVICLTSNCMRVKRAAWVCLHVCVMWGQPVAALRSGAWSSALWRRGACLWQAAVISGAQRAEYVRLSRLHEPFRPATLQFVSHFASYSSLNAAAPCAFEMLPIVLPCISFYASCGEVDLKHWLVRCYQITFAW